MISKSEDKDYNDLNSDSTSPTSLSTLNSNPMAYTIKQTVVSGHTFSISNRYDFTNCRILGRGSYGVVSQAIDTLTKQRLAIKRIRPYANDEWDGRHTLREIRLMKLLSNHPNVITLYELSLFQEKMELYMVMELMDCDLHHIIQSKQALTEMHYKCFARQILEGLKAMHAIGVFHRDLKPGNLLVSKDCQLRITDFGLARYMDDETLRGNNESNPQTEYVVTRWYRCPELLLSPNRPYSTAIDLWSVGCIMAELIRRKPLFPGKSHANQVQLIFEVLGYSHPSELGFPISAEATSFLNKRCKSPGQDLWDVIPEASEEAICFIAAMLDINPKHRPTASQALDLPYMMDADIVCDYSNAYCQPPKPGMFKFERQKLTTDELKELIHIEVFSSTPGDLHNDDTINENTTCNASEEVQEPRACVYPTRTNKAEPTSAVVSTVIANTAATAPPPLESSRAAVVKDEITTDSSRAKSASNIFAAIGAAAISVMAGDRKISPRAATATVVGKSPRAAMASSTESTVTSTSVAANKTHESIILDNHREVTKSEVTFAHDATFSCKYSGPLAASADQSSAEAATVVRGHHSNHAVTENKKYPSVASHSEKGITNIPEPEAADVGLVAHHSDDKSNSSSSSSSSTMKDMDHETNGATPRDGWFPKKHVQPPADLTEKSRSFSMRTKSKAETCDEKGSVSFMQSLRSKLTNTSNHRNLPIDKEPAVSSTETDTVSQRNTLPMLRPLSSIFSGLSLSGNKTNGSTTTRSDYQQDASVCSTHSQLSRMGQGDDEMLPYVKELDYNPDQYSSAVDTDHVTRHSALEKKHSATEFPKLSSSSTSSAVPSAASQVESSAVHVMIIEDVSQRGASRPLEPIHKHNNSRNSEPHQHDVATAIKFLSAPTADSSVADHPIGSLDSLSSGGSGVGSPPVTNHKSTEASTRSGSFATSQNSTACMSERSMFSDVTDRSTSNSSREQLASAMMNQCIQEQHKHFEGNNSMENVKNSLLPTISR